MVSVKRWAIVLASVYLLGYAVLRTFSVEIWEKNGEAYVMFPERRIALYHAYRPLTYVDGALTGMRFHIGPHR